MTAQRFDLKVKSLLSPCQAEPVRVVQPSPVSTREQGHVGKPVHPGKQPVVPCGWLHAAGIRDNAQSLVHQMCQRRLVS